MEEKSLYYYHSDHLGSTSYVTDRDGKVSQFVAYLPFGESLYEQHSNTKDMPYLFNGKERDEETGLYYYGARYYDPWAAVWAGVDPMWSKYLSLNPYHYCSNNPINRIDPNGEYDYEVNLTTKQTTRTGEKGSPDRLIVTKENGEKITSQEYAKGTIKSSKSYTEKDGTKWSYLRVKGDDDGKSMFEFLAKNTEQEWGHTKLGDKEGAKGLNYLTTSYEKSTESGFGLLIDKKLSYSNYTLREHNHNHPSGSSYPSGSSDRRSTGEKAGTWGDIKALDDYSNIFNVKSAKYHIYTTADGGKYTEYNKNTRKR